MTKKTFKTGTAALLLSLALGAQAWGDVVFHPREVGADVDFGQIVSGQEEGSDWSRQTLTRTGVYLTTSATVNEKLDFFMTIGGLFWYPIHPGESSPERLVRFGPGVGQAQGIYTFGDKNDPIGKLQFGLFSMKYNSDATNLGEYLFRSGTYPGSLITGGWSYVNSASYLAQGVRFTLPTFGGRVTHDFTLFMERDYEPTSDFSPGYVITAKPVNYLELGAGVVWAHALSLNPDRLSPRKTLSDTLTNGYNKATGRPIRGAVTHADSVAGIGFYTFRGFKTMARASLDVGSLIGLQNVTTDLGARIGLQGASKNELKVYSEIALLGVEDQPFYYDDKSERMPIMAGISIPTFGIFDQLSLEVEYHKSKFRNSVGAPFYYSLPLPLDDDGTIDNPYAYDLSTYPVADRDSIANSWKKDDWHWSVYASRNIVPGIRVYGQIASDHQRHPTGPEVKPSIEPPTQKPSDWYYVVRLEFGLF